MCDGTASANLGAQFEGGGGGGGGRENKDIMEILNKSKSHPKRFSCLIKDRQQSIRPILVWSHYTED